MLTQLNQLVQTMPTWVALPLGFAALVYGGHWLVFGAVAIARRLGLSTLLIGLTIVAVGTSLPELVFNLFAAGRGNTDLTFGNVVGSNFANIGLVLGVGALIAPISVHGRIVSKELPWLIAVTLLFGLILFAPWSRHDGRDYVYTSIDGVIMLTGFVAFIVSWWRMSVRGKLDPMRTEMEAEAAAIDPGSMTQALGMVGLGVVCLTLGGQLAESGAVRIAQALGWSQTVIGLTVVAIATSLPEMSATIAACRKGHTDLALGNVIGSNLFNILLVLGTTSLFAPVALPTPVGWYDLGAMTVMTVVLLPIAATGPRRVDRWEGILMLMLYAGYLGYRVWTTLKP